jgi:hypothetical protein
MAKSKKQIPAVEQLQETTKKQLQVIADAVGCDETLEELASRVTAYSSSKIISEHESILRDGEAFRVDGQMISPVRVTTDAPKAREFTPRDCTLCITSRPPRQQFSRVYAKRGKIRYCKCGYCGNTWSQEGD